jgi:hypothetical protein
MSRRNARPIFFVCAGMVDQKMVVITIQGINQQEAIDKFIQDYGMHPTEVLGPFYKKRLQITKTEQTIKLTNQIKKAIYNGWIVNAFLLLEPADHAFLVFIKRQDGKKMPSPSGTITVPLSHLKEI